MANRMVEPQLNYASTKYEEKSPEGNEELGALTKAKLSDQLFEQIGLNKQEAKEMVDSFFDEISTALVRGETVKLTGFGNFELRDKSPRPGRNPKTGETVYIAARRVVTFRASTKLKETNVSQPK